MAINVSQQADNTSSRRARKMVYDLCMYKGYIINTFHSHSCELGFTELMNAS